MFTEERVGWGASEAEDHEQLIDRKSARLRNWLRRHTQQRPSRPSLAQPSPAQPDCAWLLPKIQRCWTPKRLRLCFCAHLAMFSSPGAAAEAVGYTIQQSDEQSIPFCATRILPGQDRYGWARRQAFKQSYPEEVEPEDAEE